MITITFLDAINDIKPDSGNSAKWCYLGKDALKRDYVARILGIKNKCSLKSRLYDIAKSKRQHYLDLVSGLGKGQIDMLSWWAGKFSSKSPFQTDFFLLFCYGYLARALVTENKAHKSEKLIIIIEDPWLFTQLKRDASISDVLWKGDPSLFKYKFGYVVRGCIRRLTLPIWFLMARTLIRIYHGGTKPKAVSSSGDAVALINPAEKRVFGKDGRYEAPYMPGIHDFFTENSRRSFYLYIFPFPLSTAPSVGKNSDILWPLIYDAGWMSILKRTFQAWIPARKDAILDGHDLSLLFERERWIAFSNLGFNFHLIQFDALEHFMKRGWVSSFVYLFENLPWEKMLCTAASLNGKKAIGYQHSSICTYYVSQFIGQGEWKNAPLPHRLVTAGEHSARLYAEGGIPKDKIVIGGAWRYQHIFDAPKECRDKPYDKAAKINILVSLPLNIFIVKSLLTQLSASLDNSVGRESMEIVIKPHPGALDVELAEIRRLASGYTISSGPFVDLMKKADAVVVSTSTSGLEAFLMGKRVITYIPENLIVPDPLLDIDDDRICKWFEGEVLDPSFFLPLSHAGAGEEDTQKIMSHYFSKVDRKRWLELVA